MSLLPGLIWFKNFVSWNFLNDIILRFSSLWRKHICGPPVNFMISLKPILYQHFIDSKSHSQLQNCCYDFAKLNVSNNYLVLTFHRCQLSLTLDVGADHVEWAIKLQCALQPWLESPFWIIIWNWPWMVEVFSLFNIKFSLHRLSSSGHEFYRVAMLLWGGIPSGREIDVAVNASGEGGLVGFSLVAAVICGIFEAGSGFRVEWSITGKVLFLFFKTFLLVLTKLASWQGDWTPGLDTFL